MRQRVNQAAVKAGQLAFNLDRGDRVDTAGSNDPAALSAAVASANEKASNIAMPTEVEALSSVLKD